MTISLKWTRLLIIPLLLVSAAIPFLASQKQMMYAIILLCGVGGGVLLLLNPYLGLAGLVIASQLLPYEIGTGTQSGINAALLLTGGLTAVWLFDGIILKGNLNLISSKTFVPLICFAFSAFLSFAAGQLHWFPVSGAPMRAQIGGLAIFILSACAYLIMANLIKDIAWLERICWIFLGVAAFYLLGYHYIFFIAPSIGSRLLPIFRQGAAGSLFWIWVMAIPFSQLLINHKLSTKARILLGALLAATFYIRFVISLSWTSGWLPALVGMVVIFFLYARRPGVLIAMLGLVVIGIYGTTLFDKLLVSDNQYSIDTRLEAWLVLAQIARYSPILGFGPANYYWYTPLYNIMGYYVSFNSHNNYVDLVLQTGFLGLITFIWFFVSVWLLAWRLKDRVPEGFQRAYVYGCLGGIAATIVSGMFGDWVVPFVYNIGFVGFRASVYTWLFLGALVAIEHQLLKNGAEDQPAHTRPAASLHLEPDEREP